MKNMAQRIRKRFGRQEGFTLIEVLIGVFLVAVAVLGLAELFTLSLMNTRRSSDIANAVFLAQQEVDYLRTLTNTELSSFPNAGRAESADKEIDVNADGTPEYRVITVLTNLSPTFNVEVLVFPPSQFHRAYSTLVANPERYGVKARLNTVITR
jgi:prepilin-type N-terminal cleavage/methylation domain-containing protein